MLRRSLRNYVRILFLFSLIPAACKSAEKKAEPPPLPAEQSVSAEPQPIIESAIAQRLAEMESEEEMVVAGTPELGLRESPGLDGAVIAGIPYGTKVAVLHRARWCKIRYDGKTGYARGRYLREPGKTKRFHAKKGRNHHRH